MNRGRNGMEIYLIYDVDTQNPIQWGLFPHNMAEVKMTEAMLRFSKKSNPTINDGRKKTMMHVNLEYENVAIGATLCADRGYDSNPLRNQFGEQGYKTCIPQCSNVKVEPINHVSYQSSSTTRPSARDFRASFAAFTPILK